MAVSLTPIAVGLAARTIHAEPEAVIVVIAAADHHQNLLLMVFSVLVLAGPR